LRRAHSEEEMRPPRASSVSPVTAPPAVHGAI
jgi:hypothetical protein